MRTNQEEGDIQIYQKMNKVFENDFLREKILDYVIREEDSINSSDACSVRLVQKAWRRDVNKLLYKSRMPLFHLLLTLENSLNDSEYVQETGYKLLDHFVAAMEHSVDNLIHPFSLEIDEEFFCDENYESFSKFLTSGLCEFGLLKLEVWVPLNGGSMTLVFPETVFFYGLKVLKVVFCWHNSTLNQVGNITVANNGSNSNFVPFLQFILNKTDGMCEFIFHSYIRKVVPAGIKYLFLPNSLRQLCCDTFFIEDKLQGLIRNSLPNLVSLSFNINEIPIRDSLIFQILDNVKTTLRYFTLNKASKGAAFNGNSKYVLRFPCMVCLETCEIDCILVQLDNSNAALEQLLPKLKILKLISLTRNSLEQWTENSCFSTVTDIHIDWQSRRRLITFTKDHMQIVHLTFPNLERFSFLIQAGSNITGEALQYLFQNMRQLKFLSFGLRNPNLENTVCWDSLLCGIPISVASALSDHPDFWDYIELKQSSDFPSIKNLTALQGLKLYTDKYASSSQPLISNLSFHHAFKRMPNLKTILLQGRFTPSDKITTLASTHKSTQGDREIYFSRL